MLRNRVGHSHLLCQAADWGVEQVHDREHASAGAEESQNLLDLNHIQKDRGVLILRRFVVAGRASTTMLVHSFTPARHGREIFYES